MGKKYYCDFCDKSFPDNVEGRKKHNAGLVHKKMKQAHYNLFVSSRTKLNQELAKGPCRRFQQGMVCQFGDDCRFSHLLPHEIEELRRSALNEEVWNARIPSQLLKEREPDVKVFIQKVESMVFEKKKNNNFEETLKKS